MESGLLVHESACRTAASQAIWIDRGRSSQMGMGLPWKFLLPVEAA
jgi:hypothetical protein